MEVLFRSRRAIISFKALREARAVSTSLTELIEWHTMARYGKVDDDTREFNRLAIERGKGQVLSNFEIEGRRFRIVTDVAKGLTTVMMAEENKG